MGVPVTATPVHDDWLVDERLLARLGTRLRELVAGWRRDRPLEPGPPVDAVRRALRLPDRSLVHALVAPPLAVESGRVVVAGRREELPAAVANAVAAVRAELAVRPFAAPSAERLAALGLGPKELGAAVRAGALVRIGEGVVLVPDSLTAAARVLATLPEPFTLSEARQALDTTRRVAVPLLELLDRTGVTQRLPDDRRKVRR
jgi:selenocysteine-specific elongation factor